MAFRPQPRGKVGATLRLDVNPSSVIIITAADAAVRDSHASFLLPSRFPVASHDPAVSVSVPHTSAPEVEVWGISSPVGRNIQSGLRHGLVPTGAVETESIERVLTPGVRYRVTVSLADRTTGFVDFTP